MINTILVCYDMKKVSSYSQLVLVVILMASMFDINMAAPTQHQLFSQGNKSHTFSERFVTSNFCNKNLKSLLNYNSQELEISSSLSSNRGPSSSSNNNSPSSKNTSLPQGSIHRFTLTPNLLSTKSYRIDSDTLMPLHPMAGCISLLNYYWRYNVSLKENENLFGVQIFIFHLYNHHDAYMDLRILLHSTQDMALQRPVIIVLSSFLPRRFYLSVLSYLSQTHQPIHIMLTNFGSDVLIAYEDLNDTDMTRIFISVLDSSYDKIFPNIQMKEYEGIENIYKGIVQTDLYKYGHFSGFRYQSVSKNKTPQKLWLFDNGQQYSKRTPDIKIVAIEIVRRTVNLINIELGKMEDRKNEEFNHQECTVVNIDNSKVLKDRISTYLKSNFPLDELRTCSYDVHSSLENYKYKYVTWLHFEKAVNNTINLKLSSGRLFNKDETYLVILTARTIKRSRINVEPFFLHHRVHILSNISLDQFDQRSSRSSSLILFQSMRSNDSSVAEQYRMTSNYIDNSSPSIMQTTIYKLKDNNTYDIRVNVDNSRTHSYRSVIVNPSCQCHSQTNITLSLSLDLKIWKLMNSWIPSEFQFGIGNQFFQRINDTFMTFTTQLNECRSNGGLHNIQRRLYGIWRGQKYLLYLPVKFRCTYLNNERKKYENPNPYQSEVTTSSSQENLLEKSEHGFNVFNDSSYKTLLNNKALHDNGRIYVELTQNIAGKISIYEAIQLRDCYITDQKASKDDLNSSNHISNKLKKVHIIRGGCINQTNFPFYDKDESMRPMNHFKSSHLMYRFSVYIDGNIWASQLSLQHNWLSQNRLEVHLYCGVTRCYIDKSGLLNPLPDIGECNKEEDCSNQATPEQLYMYFGSLLITRNHSTTLKISVLITLNIVIVILLLNLVIFLLRLYKFRSRYKHCRSANADHWTTSCPANVDDVSKTPKVRVDYRSLKLLDGTNMSSAGLYIDRNLQSSSSGSLKHLIVDSDKSIVLQAAYLPSSLPVKQVHGASALPNRQSRLLSHSISELGVSELGLVDKALHSWPLSSTDRHRRSHHSQPPPRQSSFRFPKNSDHYRLTLSNNLKISITFTSEMKSFSYSSNPKLSSNRTTVSGESASANDMPNKSFRWWSPLSNCSVNKNVVMSRN